MLPDGRAQFYCLPFIRTNLMDKTELSRIPELDNFMRHFIPMQRIHSPTKLGMNSEGSLNEIVKG